MKNPKEKRPKLSVNIIDRRKMRRLTQLTLAQDAGVGLTTLKEIELGLSSGQRATLEAIAEVLGCSVDELYGETPKPEPTVSSLLQVLTDLQKQLDEKIIEMDKLKAHPALEAYEKLSLGNREVALNSLKNLLKAQDLENKKQANPSQPRRKS